MKACNFAKYGVLFLILALISNTASAQGLFPELGAIPERGQKTEPVQEPTNNIGEAKAAISDEDIPEPEQNAVLPEQEQNANELEEDVYELEQDTAQPEEATLTSNPKFDVKDEAFNTDSTAPSRIFMYVTDLNVTLTPVVAASYCFATLKLQNQLNRPVQQFSATVTYGQFPITFKTRNIAPGATVSQKITLVSSACTMLADEPQVDISACNVPEMSFEECKSKFLFQEPTPEF